MFGHNGGMVPDYELADTVYADTPEKMRAIVDPLRNQILHLVMDRAATVTELAVALHRPKSSVAYHVDVLVGAGMLQVVRTRRGPRHGGEVLRPHRTDHRLRRTRPARRRHCPELPRRGDRRGPARRRTRRDRPSVTPASHRIGSASSSIASSCSPRSSRTLPREGDVVYGFIAAAYPTDRPILPAVPSLSEEVR